MLLGRPACVLGVLLRAYLGAVMATVLETFRSKSRPGLEHQVRLGRDGRVYCTCERWIFQHGPRGARRDCKHVAQVRRRLGKRLRWEQLPLFGDGG